MAVTFPRTDIISSVKYADQDFQLVSRQELSRVAGGRTYAKDLGSAIWTAAYTTVDMAHDDAVAFEAALKSLDGAIQTFEAFDLRRVKPRAYPTGTEGVGVGDGALVSVTNNKALVVDTYASQIVSAGDYLSFDYGGSRALHQAVETVQANGAGRTPTFEVRPYVRPGYVSGSLVRLFAPRGIFSLLPGSVSSKIASPLRSVVSFQAVQVL